MEIILVINMVMVEKRGQQVEDHIEHRMMPIRLAKTKDAEEVAHGQKRARSYPNGAAHSGQPPTFARSWTALDRTR